MSVPTFRAPVGHPVVIKGMAAMSTCRLESNWSVSAADSSYNLYFNKNFSGMPENGDPLGIVRHIVALAKLNDAGVTDIRIESHRVDVTFSSAVSVEKRHQLLVAAIRRAGISDYEITLYRN